MSFGITQEQGRPVKIKDEGVTLTPNVAEIDFTGGGVRGTVVGDVIEEEISGSGLVPVAYDYFSWTRDGDGFLSSLTFKTGGAGGSTVATVTITRNADGFIEEIETVMGATTVTRTIARNANNFITSVTIT